MGGWRTKSTFMLVVFFAGFATAIYTLSPSAKGGEITASVKNKTTISADEACSKVEELITKFKPKIQEYFKLAKERSGQLTKAVEAREF